VVAIPNGIEVERFQSPERRDLRRELGLPPESFLIGFLGRFMSQKGFKYLVDALAVIAGEKNLPKRSVILAFGEDGFIREEREAVRARGLTDAVYFLPFVSDIAPTLKGLDVVAMPSLWEACGLLAMEAMVAGVPLIGTNCIGLREVLRDTPARVVPASDGVALSRALITEMENPTTAEARKFAVEAASRFRVKERAAAIEKLMLEFLER
jgi:glycosyltransferase involved in cell wall biosynthesis